MTLSDSRFKGSEQSQGLIRGQGSGKSISTDEIGEVLEKSLGFDFDVVNPGVVRSEITMPLPRLAAGQWTLADASHKMLDDFKLDPEEQQLIDRFQAKVLEEAEKRKKMMPVQIEKGGFSRFMLNSAQLTRDVDDTANLTNQLFARDGTGQERSAAINPGMTTKRSLKN